MKWETLLVILAPNPYPVDTSWVNFILNRQAKPSSSSLKKENSWDGCNKTNIKIVTERYFVNLIALCI